MKIDKISIIIASYNNIKLIKETIDSTLNQDYENIEVIIADDGTENFNIEEYRKYINKTKKDNITNVVIYTNKTNLGTVKNMNKAIPMASGEYIKLIGGDDVFYDNKVISNVVKYMKQHNENIITTNLLLCDKDMNKILDSEDWLKEFKEKLPLGSNPKEFYKFLATGKTISPGVFFKKEFFKEHGLFNEEYKLLEDWPMWLKLSRNGIKIGYLDIISVKYRIVGGISNGGIKNKIFLNDIIKCYEQEIIPFRKELGYWFHKQIKFKFIKKFRYGSYSVIQKLEFIIFFIDVILANRIIKIKGRLRNKKCELITQ